MVLLSNVLSYSCLGEASVLDFPLYISRRQSSPRGEYAAGSSAIFSLCAQLLFTAGHLGFHCEPEDNWKRAGSKCSVLMTQ